MAISMISSPTLSLRPKKYHAASPSFLEALSADPKTPSSHPITTPPGFLADTSTDSLFTCRAYLLHEKHKISAAARQNNGSHVSLPARPVPQRSSSLAAGFRASNRTGVSACTTLADGDDIGAEGSGESKQPGARMEGGTRDVTPTSLGGDAVSLA